MESVGRLGPEAMSSLLELPAEVHEFLLRPTPQTLLVRGPPGCGKSTFALSLLQNFRGRKFYVTSRVSKAELLRDHPWLNDGSGITVIDSASRRDTLAESARVLASARELIEHPEKEPELQGLWLPGPIQEVYAEAKESDPIIAVVDSWDALVERYLGPPTPGLGGSPDRAEMERLVLDQMARGPIFLVLVVERDERSQLDYLVNGVVATRWEVHDGRPERWIDLPKLRGTRIDHPSYPFTLEGGRFQCILPLAGRFATRLQAGTKEPDTLPGYLWPGSNEFARAFGRLRIGTISTFERDNAVPVPAVRLLINPIVAQVAQHNGRIVHILPPNLPPEEIWQAYLSLMDTGAFLRQVRLQIASGALRIPDEIVPALLPSPIEMGDPASPRTPEAQKFLENAPAGTQSLSVVWISGLRALTATNPVPYTPETLPAIALDYVARGAVHVVFVGVKGDPLLDSLKPIASLQLRLRSRAGRSFVYGETPVTPDYVLSEGDLGSPYHLLRVV